MSRILVIGPFPEPTTGVSLANKVVVEGLSERTKTTIDLINTSYDKFEENIGAFSLSKALFYLKLKLHVFKVFKSDVVYVTPGQTFFGVLKYALFIVMGWLANKEIIIHVHGNYLGKEYTLIKGLRKKLFKWILNKTSKGIVLSESLKGNMSPFINDEQIFVLYNFVEDYLFLEEQVVFDTVEEFKPKIIFLSNLMEEKGILDLLEALKKLELDGVKFEAKIAGNIDHKNKNKIDAYFKALKQVSYCGVVSGSEKRDLLLWGNVFVLPTYYEMEGQPISILEAMATGNLVLTTNHAGIPDVFKNGVNGYFVDKQDSESIVQRIKDINKDVKFSNEIRKNNFIHASKHYKVDNFIDKFIKIIEA